MASITNNFGTKTDPKYGVRYRTPAGKCRSRTFPRKADADQFLLTVESSEVVGAYVERSAGAVTLGEWFERWIATTRTTSGQTLRPKTVGQIRVTTVSTPPLNVV